MKGDSAEVFNRLIIGYASFVFEIVDAAVILRQGVLVIAHDAGQKLLFFYGKNGFFSGLV